MPKSKMSMCSDCHTRVHVWHPVDPGSSPGGVTTLSLRYSPLVMPTERHYAA